MIFITGIGTGIGKTVVSAIVTEALEADYWKPIQAGFEDGTDALQVSSLISNKKTIIHPEVYKLQMPASPHISARNEGASISIESIVDRLPSTDYRSGGQRLTVKGERSTDYCQPLTEGEDGGQRSTAGGQRSTINSKPLIIEGAGGILVPLNDNEFVIDLIEQLGAKVILVSRNYLGSINHSLLTAAICKQRNIDVIGWIFNDQYLDYEEEIVRWTGYPKIASIPLTEKIDKAFVLQQAGLVKEALLRLSALKR